MVVQAPKLGVCRRAAQPRTFVAAATCAPEVRLLACVLALLSVVTLPGWAAAQTAQRASTATLDSIVLPSELARPHARGGWRLAPVFGDSTDHTRHSALTVGALSTSLLVFLWTLPEDYPRFYTRDPTFRQLRESYTRPPLWNDGDWWVWNWIAHPAVGTHEYLLERNWGVSPLRAFLFSTIASVAWEYGWEAWMERPSVQDLLLTSPAGAVIGEGIFQLTRQLRRNGLSTPEKLVVVLLNPLHVLQHGLR